MSEPLRTAIRTGMETALQSLETNSEAYFRAFKLQRTWDLVEELKQSPTYSVVVTDESIGDLSHTHKSCTVDGIVVVQVRDADDPRIVLDKTIEDVWRAVMSDPTLGGVVRETSIESIECDDGTKIARPFAQAVMRFACLASRMRRPA